TCRSCCRGTVRWASRFTPHGRGRRTDHAAGCERQAGWRGDEWAYGLAFEGRHVRGRGAGSEGISIQDGSAETGPHLGSCGEGLCGRIETGEWNMGRLMCATGSGCGSLPAALLLEWLRTRVERGCPKLLRCIADGEVGGVHDVASLTVEVLTPTWLDRR